MAGFPICPPGLEYLLQVNELRIKQTRASVFQSYCTYDVLGPEGHLVYRATERRECCGPRMALTVTNTQGYNVLHLLVPFECCSCETKLQVSGSSGELLGYIDRNLTSFAASFDILDPSGLICLKVKGPGWGEGFMSDSHYQVLSVDKTTQVGVITRVWRGLKKEMFSIKDNYIMSFPLDLSANMKAMLLACTLFIDLLQEEANRNNSNSSS
ncbi:phospholipid scramblase 3-like [Hyperolius riggenbachi]|uniref:phospholipid scramblase 3-like n=1 Tax=Hyperolius riggenbachi TaxID=752182 RepID=UPI0035A2802E